MKSSDEVKNGYQETTNLFESKIMQPAVKELLKEYVQSQQFTSTADIMQAMKEMFCGLLK